MNAWDAASDMDLLNFEDSLYVKVNTPGTTIIQSVAALRLIRAIAEARIGQECICSDCDAFRRIVALCDDGLQPQQDDTNESEKVNAGKNDSL